MDKYFYQTYPLTSKVANAIRGIFMEDHQKDHLEVCLPNSRLISGLIGMRSSMKITLIG